MEIIDLKLKKNINHSKYKGRLKFCLNMLKVLKYLNKIVYDKCFVLTYDVILILFFIKILNLKNKEIYLYEHHQLIEYSHKIKRIFTNRYKNKVKHIILEEIFASEFLIKNKIKLENIKIVHHPIIEEGEERQNNFNDRIQIKKYQILGISSSNLESKNNVIYKKTKEANWQYSILIRSKNLNYNFEDKIVFEKKFYNDYELQELYKKTELVLVLIDEKNFKMRLSGNIYNAINFNKCLLLPDWEYSRYLKALYPNIIFIYQDINYIDKDIEQFFKNRNLTLELEDFKKFKEYYSNKNIILELKKAFL